MNKNLLADLGYFIRCDGEFRDSYVRQFEVLIKFLQDNGLLKYRLLADGKKPNTRTRIYESDLTPEGFLVMKEPYARFLQTIPEKGVRILEKALKEMRGSSLGARKSSGGARRKRTRR